MLKPHAAQENLFNAIAAAAATRINYLSGKRWLPAGKYPEIV